MHLFWEAASAFVCQSKFAPSEAARLFRHFYNGLNADHLVWYPYLDSGDKYELLAKFHFEKVYSEDDSMTNLKKVIIPGILPIDFYSGRNHQPTYEFYYPSDGSGQLGFGQLPIHPFFANLVQPWQTITSCVEYDRLKNLTSDIHITDLGNWHIGILHNHPIQIMVGGMESTSFLRPSRFVLLQT